MNVRDDFHGTDGPIPVWRLPREDWLPVNEAFHQATIAEGFLEDTDMNNPDSTGTGAIPMNNPGGIRMSAALAYLNPNRHRLNLTIKANVLALRVVFEGNQAVGVEVEEQWREVHRDGFGDCSLRRWHCFSSVAASFGRWASQ